MGFWSKLFGKKDDKEEDNTPAPEMTTEAPV